MTPASSPTGDTAAVPPVPTLDRDGFDERFVMAAAEANRAGEDVGHLPTVADELYSMVQRRDAEIDRLRAELAEEKREHLATINDALRVKQAWAAREQTLAAPPAASSSPDDTAPDDGLTARIEALAAQKEANATRLFADHEKATNPGAKIVLFAKAGSERHHAKQLRALLAEAAASAAVPDTGHPPITVATDAERCTCTADRCLATCVICGWIGYPGGCPVEPPPGDATVPVTADGDVSAEP